MKPRILPTHTDPRERCPYCGVHANRLQAKAYVISVGITSALWIGITLALEHFK